MVFSERWITVHRLDLAGTAPLPDPVPSRAPFRPGLPLPTSDPWTTASKTEAEQTTVFRAVLQEHTARNDDAFRGVPFCCRAERTTAHSDPPPLLCGVHAQYGTDHGTTRPVSLPLSMTMTCYEHNCRKNPIVLIRNAVLLCTISQRNVSACIRDDSFVVRTQSANDFSMFR